MQHSPRRRSSPIVLAVALALACGGSDGPTPAPDPTISGTYLLRTVNGSPLPYTVPGEGGVTFTAGSLVIDRADSLTIATTYRYGDITSSFNERYGYARPSAGALLMRSSGGSQFTLTGDGSAVEYAEGAGPGDPGLRFRFTK